MIFKAYKMKNKYEVKDDIACILIDNQISVKDIKEMFDELIQMKKDGCFDAEDEKT